MVKEVEYFEELDESLEEVDILDNPGKGDCLFYSIAASMVHFMQTNPDRARAYALWTKWSHEGELSDKVSYRHILEERLTEAPTKDSDFKTLLQHSLRNIAADALFKKSKILFAAQYLPESEYYRQRQAKIAALNTDLCEYDELFNLVDEQSNLAKEYQATITQTRASNGYKWTAELKILDEERKAILKEVEQSPAAQNLTRMRSIEEISTKRNQRSLLTQNQMERDPVYVNFKNLFIHFKDSRTRFRDLHNLFNNCGPVYALANSLATQIEIEQLPEIMKLRSDYWTILFKGINEIRNRFHWGTAEHAAAIFSTLELNSSIQGNEELNQAADLSFGENAPLISIMNVNNGHWVSLVDTYLKSYPFENEKLSPQKASSSRDTMWGGAVTRALSTENTSSAPSEVSTKCSVSKRSRSPEPSVSETKPNVKAQKAVTCDFTNSEIDFIKACKSSKESMLENYLNVNPYTSNKVLTQALITAAMYGHKEIVKKLIAKAAPINGVDDLGNTALHWAAWHEKKEVVEELLRWEADVLKKNNNGSIALVSAEKRNHIEIIQLLKGAAAKLEDSASSVGCGR